MNNVFKASRIISVNWLTKASCSCAPVNPVFCTVNRSCSSKSSNDQTPQPNNNLQISSKFYNRNPRALEFMGLAKKPKGWDFTYPPKEFYHRLVFEKSERYITARVEHNSGKVVISASTKEFAIAQHLFSTSDVAAAENIGRVLSQRCRESGLTKMSLLPPEGGETSEKFKAFERAVLEGGIELSEPEEVMPDYEPGIEYDNKEAVENLLDRQTKVHNLSDEHLKILKFRSRKHGSRRKIPPAPKNILRTN